MHIVTLKSKILNRTISIKKPELFRGDEGEGHVFFAYFIYLTLELIWILLLNQIIDQTPEELEQCAKILL